jgi:protein gp37
MAGLSDIEWTDATWNPIAGCAMVSPGCTNCYAMRMAARLQAMGHPAYKSVTRKSGGRPVWTGRINVNDKALAVPLTWRVPKKVFVNSMSDLFQEGVPADLVASVWKVMAAAHWHVFQILTKRPDNMLKIVKDANLPTLPNVWLGTSIESANYKSRIGILRRVPAAVRFVSFEPLVGPVGKIDLSKIQWAIVGGESGPKARPMDREWVDELLVQCKDQKTAFFFKQWGGTNKKSTGRLYNGRTWDDFPPSSLLTAAE